MYEGSATCSPYDGYSYTYNLVEVRTGSEVASARVYTFCESSFGTYPSTLTKFGLFITVAEEDASVFWNGKHQSGGDLCWIRVTLPQSEMTEYPCPAGMRPPRVPAVLP